MKLLSSAGIVLAFVLSTIAYAEDLKSGTSDPNNSNTTSQNKNLNPEKSEHKDEVFAKWEKVFEDKSMQVYVDVNNIKWEDGRATIWKMMDLNKKLKDGTLSLWVAEAEYCGKNLVQEAIVIHFKGQFGSGKQISRDDNGSDIQRIKPGSMDEAVYEYVCKLKH
jgi:hypothetical protein